MRVFKNIHTDKVISETQYNNLSDWDKCSYEETESDNSDFLISGIIGAATDSALLGGLLGGDLLGGILGDSLDGDLFD